MPCLPVSILFVLMVALPLALFSLPALSAEPVADALPASPHRYAVGRLEQAERYPILAKVEGTVERLHVAAGRTVAPGARLVQVRPLDPGFVGGIQVSPGGAPRRVLSVAVREGDFVVRNQVLMTLIDPGQMQVRARLYAVGAADVDIGQKVRVMFDPDRDAIAVPGTVRAVHVVESTRVPMIEVEIGLALAQCRRKDACRALLVQGAVVRVEI